MKKGKKIINKIENIFVKKKKKESEISSSNNGLTKEQNIDSGSLEANKGKLTKNEVTSLQQEERKDIHLEFTPESKQEREEKDFSNEEPKKEFSSYNCGEELACKKCYEKEWCQSCNTKHFQEEFNN